MKSISLRPGTLADWHALAPFHYRSHRCGAVIRVWTAEYLPPAPAAPPALAGVVVVSLPALACRLRDLATHGHFSGGPRPLAAAQLNREVRCLSRVVVHPLFRGMGLAVRLVRWALDHADTPYTEALAAMGRVQGFFKAAGMQEYDRPPDDRAARLLAALQLAHLAGLDLCCDTVWRGKLAAAPPATQALIACELTRYVGSRRTLEDMVAQARRKVLSWPLYYLWQKPCGES